MGPRSLNLQVGVHVCPLELEALEAGVLLLVGTYAATHRAHGRRQGGAEVLGAGVLFYFRILNVISRPGLRPRLPRDLHLVGLWPDEAALLLSHFFDNPLVRTLLVPEMATCLVV